MTKPFRPRHTNRALRNALPKDADPNSAFTVFTGDRVRTSLSPDLDCDSDGDDFPFPVIWDNDPDNDETGPVFAVGIGWLLLQRQYRPSCRSSVKPAWAPEADAIGGYLESDPRFIRTTPNLKPRRVLRC